MLVDLGRVRRNIARMAAKAQLAGLRFRPHFKTHQSVAVGEIFRQLGCTAITVSSVAMAEYFARAGWRDITVAFSLNPRQIASISGLARRIDLGVLIENEEAITALEDAVDAPLRVWIKIDAGYGRTGVPWRRVEDVVALARRVDALPQLRLKGLLTHGGQTYHARSPSHIAALYGETVRRLDRVRTALFELGFHDLELSVGDTPACACIEDFLGVDEIRPGNFVFYDLMQHALGVCAVEDLAVAVACPVVALHPGRGEIVLYGGAVHLSKESISTKDGESLFGRVALFDGARWGPLVDGACLRTLSQEHGVVQAPQGLFHKLHVGDLLAVLPVHVCLTANLLGRYLTLDGDCLDHMSGTPRRSRVEIPSSPESD